MLRTEKLLDTVKIPAFYRLGNFNHIVMSLNIASHISVLSFYFSISILRCIKKLCVPTKLKSRIFEGILGGPPDLNLYTSSSMWSVIMIVFHIFLVHCNFIYYKYITYYLCNYVLLRGTCLWFISFMQFTALIIAHYNFKVSTPKQAHLSLTATSWDSNAVLLSPFYKEGK